MLTKKNYKKVIASIHNPDQIMSLLAKPVLQVRSDTLYSFSYNGLIYVSKGSKYRDDIKYIKIDAVEPIQKGLADTELVFDGEIVMLYANLMVDSRVDVEAVKELMSIILIYSLRRYNELTDDIFGSVLNIIDNIF